VGLCGCDEAAVMFGGLGGGPVGLGGGVTCGMG